MVEQRPEPADAASSLESEIVRLVNALEARRELRAVSLALEDLRRARGKPLALLLLARQLRRKVGLVDQAGSAGPTVYADRFKG